MVKSYSSAHRRLAGACLALGIVVSGCGTSSGGAGKGAGTSDAAQADTPVTLITASQFSTGPFLGWYLLGNEQGFFKQHHLDVKIEQGTASLTSLQLLEHEQADFAVFTSTLAVIQADSRGADLRLVGRDDVGLQVGVISKDLTSPGQLEGKTLALTAGGLQALLWPAFCTNAKIDCSKVNTVNIPANENATALAAGRVDGIVGILQGQGAALGKLGIPNPAFMDFAKYGVQISPDYGIVATNDTIKNKPNVVRELLAAINQTYQYAVQHPDQIWGAGHAYFPTSFPPDVQAAIPPIFKAIAGLNAAGTPAGKPFVYIPPDVWASSVSLMRQLNVAPNIKAPDSYYTNSFTP